MFERIVHLRKAYDRNAYAVSRNGVGCLFGRIARELRTGRMRIDFRCASALRQRADSRGD